MGFRSNCDLLEFLICMALHSQLLGNGTADGTHSTTNTCNHVSIFVQQGGAQTSMNLNQNSHCCTGVFSREDFWDHVTSKTSCGDEKLTSCLRHCHNHGMSETGACTPSQDCEVHSLGQTTWRPEVSVMESLLGGPEVLLMNSVSSAK